MEMLGVLFRVQGEGIYTYNSVIYHSVPINSIPVEPTVIQMYPMRLPRPLPPAVEIDEELLPVKAILHHAYPNPFNPTITITFDLPVASNVKFDVFDIHGRIVGARLPRPYNAGSHSITFDGSNLSSGLYLYRIETESFSAVRKMVLIK